MHDPKKGELIPLNSEEEIKAVHAEKISEKLKEASDNLSAEEKAEIAKKVIVDHPVFTKGEVVTIKGAKFRVETMGSHLMTLRPLPRNA